MTLTAAKPAEPVRTFRAFNAFYSRKKRLRNLMRDGAVHVLSYGRRMPRGPGWLRVLYYHHVFDDERSGFAAQLHALKDIGELITLDRAVELLAADAPLAGRSICLTFDDGFRNCLTNALPILAEQQVPAIFFVPTGSLAPAGERPVVRDDFFSHARIAMEFLTWDDCRALAAAGMAIGSHTVNHVAPAKLAEAEFARELNESKSAIEREIGQPCRHFSCPQGRPGLDFNPERDPRLARQAGYVSFLTTHRGSAFRRPQPLLMDRDLARADHHPRQLRYFFTR